MELPVYGDGKQIRDWLYVEDNCRAILGVLEKGHPGSIYNIGTGEERTNLDVAEAICANIAEEIAIDLAKLKGHIRFITDRPGHDRRYAIDAAKVRAEIGWNARTAFDVGLKRTIRWYLEHDDWIRRVSSGEYLKYYDSVYTQAWGVSGKAQRAGGRE
jgi:dTDP-glucose 4,6-dehydratase